MDNLDDFTLSYLETALWSSVNEEGIPLDAQYTTEDFHEKTLQQAIEDCKAFQEDNTQDLSEGSPKRAGHDFWLTRNRHGAGFWDGDWSEEVGKRLTEAAHAYGGVDLMVGDDGKIYG